MKIVSIRFVFIVCAAVSSGALLFWTSQSVQKAEHRLAALDRAIQSERQAIRVLETEWDYLNRPDRLEVLARDYFDMSPLRSEAVSGNFSVIPDPALPPVMPSRKPSMAAQPVSTGARAVPPSSVLPAAARPSHPVAPVRPDASPSSSSDSPSRDDFRSLLEDLTRQPDGDG